MGRKLIVPSSEDIAKKWKDVTPARGVYYEEETPGSADLWEANAKGAKGTYKAAVADPKISDRFVGGIGRVTAEKFKRKVVDVGIARFGPGIEAAETDMKVGIDPFRNELDGLEVPDRKPRGDKANLKIVETIFDTLHKKRLAVLGATS